jgi:hypothetical protein
MPQNPYLSLIDRYSGRYRPAWRISHTGAVGVSAPPQASRNPLVSVDIRGVVIEPSFTVVPAALTSYVACYSLRDGPGVLNGAVKPRAVQ